MSMDTTTILMVVLATITVIGTVIITVIDYLPNFPNKFVQLTVMHTGKFNKDIDEFVKLWLDAVERGDVIPKVTAHFIESPNFRLWVENKYYGYCVRGTVYGNNFELVRISYKQAMRVIALEEQLRSNQQKEYNQTPEASSTEITYEEKVKLYREHSYLMQVPPVSTYYWKEKDWIAHIDSRGVWLK